MDERQDLPEEKEQTQKKIPQEKKNDKKCNLQFSQAFESCLMAFYIVDIRVDNLA